MVCFSERLPVPELPMMFPLLDDLEVPFEDTMVRSQGAKRRKNGLRLGMQEQIMANVTSTTLEIVSLLGSKKRKWYI